MAKTEALISCEFTALLICAIVFAYAKRFPNDAAHTFSLSLPSCCRCSVSSSTCNATILDIPVKLSEYKRSEGFRAFAVLIMDSKYLSSVQAR